jgi:hypothetical protein
MGGEIMVKKILNIAFWVVFAALMFIWLVDFFRVRSEEDPMFCIRNKTYTFDDGEVKECLGLGYKVYKYDRESLTKALEFGPFFIEMREPE